MEPVKVGVVVVVVGAGKLEQSGPSLRSQQERVLPLTAAALSPAFNVQTAPVVALAAIRGTLCPPRPRPHPRPPPHPPVLLARLWLQAFHGRI